MPVRNATSPELKRETKTADDQRRWRKAGNRTNTTKTRRENAYTTGTRRERVHAEGTEDGAAACTDYSKTAQQRVPRFSSMYDKETQTQQRVQQRATCAATCTTKSYKRSHMYNTIPHRKKDIHSCRWKQTKLKLYKKTEEEC